MHICTSLRLARVLRRSRRRCVMPALCTTRRSMRGRPALLHESINLNAAKEQVEVAKQSVALANESLARSKDRFTSGVTDTVEVVQAEQALSSANDQYIPVFTTTASPSSHWLALSELRAPAMNSTSEGSNVEQDRKPNYGSARRRRYGAFGARA